MQTSTQIPAKYVDLGLSSKKLRHLGNFGRTGEAAQKALTTLCHTIIQFSRVSLCRL